MILSSLRIRRDLFPTCLILLLVTMKMTSKLTVHSFPQEFYTSNRNTASAWTIQKLIGHQITSTTRSSWKRSHSQSLTQLEMAKGDGKKKRKKQSSSGSGSSPPASSQSTPSGPQPMRVSNDINIPIRRQIQYGKINKAFRNQASGSTSFRQNNNKKVSRTKYRRTWDEEEIEEKAEQRKRKGQDPDWDLILNQTMAAKAMPLVLVDGYNIIYKWPRLKKHMVKGDLQRARQLLIDDLENLRSIKGWRIEVIFDAAGRSSRNPQGRSDGGLAETASSVKTSTTQNADRAATKEVSKFGIRTVFTGAGVEADAYIESRCAAAKEVTRGVTTGTFIVATDDAMIRMAGQNAGALCMSSDRFVTELKAVKQAVAYRVEAAMAKVNGQAMVRPESLWGTDVFSSQPGSPSAAQSVSQGANSTANSGNSTQPGLKGLKKTADGRSVYTGRYGRSLIIEDKRKKK